MAGSRFVTALIGLLGCIMVGSGVFLMTSKPRAEVPRSRYRVRLDDASKNYRNCKGAAERMLRTDNLYLSRQGG